MAFYQTNINPDSLVRGPARLLVANITVPTPANISDVINMTANASMGLYSAILPWWDLGSTKAGVQLTVNNAEEAMSVDQVNGDIEVLPNAFEASVGTQLADVTPAMCALVWEGKYSYAASSPDGPRHRVGFGQPSVYTKRKLVVLHQKTNKLIRAHFFHKVTRTAQESAVTYNREGEQQSLPHRFRALADTSITEEYDRFFITLDQDGGYGQIVSFPGTP